MRQKKLYPLAILAALTILCQEVAAQPRLVPTNYDPTTIKINYVRTWDAVAPTTDANSLSTATDPQQARMTTQYLDGLGRPIQTVVKKGSLVTSTGASADMVSATEYDPFGREQFMYLPFAATSSNGAFKTNPFQQQATFSASQYPGETFYYGQTQFEASPLNRVEKTLAPGDSWIGGNKGISIKYWINTAIDDVKMWGVTDASIPGNFGSYGLATNVYPAGTYPAGQLYKTVTEDERGKQVIKFKDKAGKVILKKVQLNGSGDNGTGRGYADWLSTYYIYDDLTQLRCVVQPKGVDILIQNGWDISSLGGGILSEQCFRYEYDAKGRMTMKKVPGAGAVYMVYDARDRLVMMQDGNLRTQGKWMVTMYENDLNRPVKTGLLSDNTGLDMHLSAAYTSIAYPSISSGFELLSETYYDDYNTLPSGLSSSLVSSGYASDLTASSGAPDYAESLTASTATKGMVTWTRVKVLGENKYLYSVNIYDDKGRVIQVQSLNYTGGLDVVTTQYSFSNQVLRSHISHTKAGGTLQTYSVGTKYNYDELKRVVSIEKNINNGGWKKINAIEYNALGQVKKKGVGVDPTNTSNPLETQVFDYNIRGWLLGTNKDYVKGQSAAKFGYELSYDKPTPTLSSQNYSPQYNGNIAGTIWKSAGDGEARRYDFSYDNTNRLLSADFNQYTGGTFNKNGGINYTVSNLSYDANGNIGSMNQYGWKPGGNINTPIDQLTYSYETNSNRLKGVSDAQNDNTSKLGDFKYDAGSKTATDYSYDVNGNLISDANKKISGIVYNYLNLTQNVTVTGKGTITYTYDAAGNKLKKEVAEIGQPIKTTLYLFGIYENDVLQYLPQEEGRIRPVRDPNQNITGFAYDYMLKDHLGNVRMVLTEEQQVTPYELLTFENQNVQQQDAQWDNRNTQSINVNSVRTARPGSMGTQGTNGDYAMLTRKSTGSIGATKLLKVMAGDRIHAKVEYFYNTASADNSTASPLNAIITSLTGAINGSPAASGLLHNEGTVLTAPLNNGSTSFANTVNAAANTNPNNSSQQAPKAYLCVLFFNEQFQFDAASSVVVPVNYAPGVKGTIDKTFSNAVPIAKSGYAYIYFTNESDELVYWDNFTLSHERGSLLEENTFYPFGLQMAGLSSKAAGGVENKRKFQNQEINTDLDVSFYEFQWRTQDPQTGRFIQIDPLADKYRFNSPYAFSENKVTSHVELEGLESVSIHTWTVNSDEVNGASTGYNCNCTTQAEAQNSYNTRKKINGSDLNINNDGMVVNTQIVQNRLLESNEHASLSSVYGIVLHRTQGSNTSGAISAMKSGGLGVHFIIDKDGTITQLASLNSWLYHVGKTRHPEYKYKSTTTIGIEHVGSYIEETSSWEPLTPAQVDASAWLVKSLMRNYNISPFDVVNHEDISWKTAGEGATIRAAIQQFIYSFDQDKINNTPAAGPAQSPPPQPNPTPPSPQPPKPA